MRRDRLVEAPRGGDVGDADPEVVDPPPHPHRPVVHGLGAVAVRVEQEGAVVVVPVLRPRARRAVVAVARPRCRRARTRRRARATARRTRCAGRASPGARRRRLRARSRPTRRTARRVRLLDAERPQHGLVEALRRLAVRDADRDVVEHAPTMPGTEVCGLLSGRDGGGEPPGARALGRCARALRGRRAPRRRPRDQHALRRERAARGPARPTRATRQRAAATRRRSAPRPIVRAAGRSRSGTLPWRRALVVAGVAALAVSGAAVASRAAGPDLVATGPEQDALIGRAALAALSFSGRRRTGRSGCSTGVRSERGAAATRPSPASQPRRRPPRARRPSRRSALHQHDPHVPLHRRHDRAEAHRRRSCGRERPAGRSCSEAGSSPAPGSTHEGDAIALDGRGCVRAPRRARAAPARARRDRRRRQREPRRVPVTVVPRRPVAADPRRARDRVRVGERRAAQGRARARARRAGSTRSSST